MFTRKYNNDNLKKRNNTHRIIAIKAAAKQARRNLIAQKESTAALERAAAIRAEREERARMLAAQEEELARMLAAEEEERAMMIAAKKEAERQRREEEDAYLETLSPERRDLWLKTRHRIPLVRCSA